MTVRRVLRIGAGLSISWLHCTFFTCLAARAFTSQESSDTQSPHFTEIRKPGLLQTESNCLRTQHFRAASCVYSRADCNQENSTSGVPLGSTSSQICHRAFYGTPFAWKCRLRAVYRHRVTCWAPCFLGLNGEVHFESSKPLRLTAPLRGFRDCSG